jgi:hypothetical protein
MDGWDILKWGAVGIGGATALGIAGRAVYRSAVKVYDDLYERWRRFQHDRLTLSDIETQNELRNIRAIPADERGRYPLLYGKEGILRDPNNLRAFTISTVLERWPRLEQIDWMHRTLIALQGVNAGAARQFPELTESAAPTIQWPPTVTIEQALRGQKPSIENIIVGAYPSADGLEVVGDSLHNLMHVLEVGASGWGKSVWMRSFLYQIAKASEPCEVVAIDTHGSEFNVLHGWGRLRYPVARNPNDAIAVLQQVSEEIDNRKEMYEQHPLVTKLTEYNEATDAGLPPWVVAIDEGTSLLNERGIGEPLRAAVQTARQYGIYILLAGQSAKHSVVDTQIRDQFSTRLCFRVSPTSSRVVLDDNAAGNLKDKGRAWVQMVGREMREVQGPFITREEFLHALSNGGPKHEMPVVSTTTATAITTDVTDSQIAQVLEMYRAGESKRAIQREVFGYEGGAAYNQVTNIIAELGGTTGTGTTEMGDLGEKDESVSSTEVSSTTDDTKFCDFCGRSVDDAPDGVTFGTCTACGVGVCSDDADDLGRCPDCAGEGE